jgi:tetratricopeptide (TPR) repeat protein
MAPSTETLELARQCQRSGNAYHARQVCQQVLQREPGNAEAWHLLGVLHQEAGQVTDALTHWQQALRLKPGAAETHYRLGSTLAQQGKRDEALAHFQQALRAQPDHAEAWASAGVTLAEQGKLDDAVRHLRQAIGLRPELARAQHNLGVALAQQGQTEEALASVREALRLQPDYAEAWYNLGNIFGTVNRREESIAAYREAIRLRPRYGEAYNNLGWALVQALRLGEAVVVLQQAVRLRPEAPEAHNNLGLAYSDLTRWAEAEASFHAALRLNPGLVDAHNNLGSLYKEQGRMDEALASYQTALWVDPNSASTRYNRSLALLQMGDYAQGWPEYEWRWQRSQARVRPFAQPRWDGSPLEGRTLLLYMEQGLGDMIHFLRYAPLVKERGGRIVVECPAMLLPLFATGPGIDQLVAEGQPLPPFDVQAPLLSLPALVGTTSLDQVPARVPYLAADPEQLAAWQAPMKRLEGFRIGLVWQGNPHHQWDRFRSVPLACFALLAKIDGVRLISLQKGAGTEQLRTCGFPVTELAPELDAEGPAFADTAAIMKHLDLVITIDTAAAHLAGALGVPVWVALSAIADRRWLQKRSDSPWYPTLRLFRQRALGDWPGVFAAMAQELRPRVAASRPRRTIPIQVAPGELIDKLTILRLKQQRFTDPAKLAHVRQELAALEMPAASGLPASGELDELTAALQAVNEALWEVEDQIRRCEQEGDFGERFVELARSVYRNNDRRCALKGQINALLGAAFSEQKMYVAYREDAKP